MVAWTRTARFESFAGHSSPVLRWQPQNGLRARVVFFPPYGDEMNQTRRMYRLTAEVLAAHGIASCMFDLKGTGDSTADFMQASVTAWLDDCRTIITPLAEESLPLVFIGCRLGAALAVQTSMALATPLASFVAWAPLWKGALQLGGLLRAARMARLARDQSAQPTQGVASATDDPKQYWAAGKPAWLAGYPVSPRLAEELQALDANEAPMARQATLFELRALGVDDPDAVSEAMKGRAQAWRQEGVPTRARVVQAPSFWNVIDLVDVPELVDATVHAVGTALGVGGQVPAGNGA